MPSDARFRSTRRALLATLPAAALAAPHLRERRLRGIGVTSPERSPAFPDVPAIAEGGLPGYEAIQWYGLFAVFIPVYAFLFIPIRTALAADCKNFLERTAQVQWALMVCVYCVSHVPALLMLEIPGYPGANARLLLFFVIVVQLSDVLQYVWGKLLGRRKIAPLLSPNKTWEGFIGGVLSASAIGAALWWATPFQPWQAGVLAFIITLMGFFGGLVMSAIKRDRGVKDYGSMIEGHGGVMDRIDSICFAAPVFFHLVRFGFTLP